MTINGFSIDFEWLSREYGSLLERATLAEIGIMAGGVYLTELEDLKSRTLAGVRPPSPASFAFDLMADNDTENNAA